MEKGRMCENTQILFAEAIIYGQCDPGGRRGE